jgi:chromosome segregation ATPase
VETTAQHLRIHQLRHHRAGHRHSALPLPAQVLRKRGEKVRTDIESARKVTEDANARLSAIEAKLSGLDGEIAKIRAQVETESKQDEARIKATMEGRERPHCGRRRAGDWPRPPRPGAAAPLCRRSGHRAGRQATGS